MSQGLFFSFQRELSYNRLTAVPEAIKALPDLFDLYVQTYILHVYESYYRTSQIIQFISSLVF